MKRMITLLFMMALPALLIAQKLERDVVATGGNYSSNANMSLSYTVGEPMIETFNSSSLVLTQGFQQSKTDTMDVGIEQQGVSINLRAYPNPTADVVVLELNSEEQRNMLVDVYDVQGKKQAIPEKELSVNGRVKKELDFGDLAAGNYFIRLRSVDGENMRTIKVQKIR